MPDNRLSANRASRLVDRIVVRYVKLTDAQIEKYVADGRPPFTEPVTDEQQLQTLTAWRNTGDPRYYRSPAAQRALVVLSERLGAPPPVSATIQPPSGGAV